MYCPTYSAALARTLNPLVMDTMMVALNLFTLGVKIPLVNFSH